MVRLGFTVPAGISITPLPSSEVTPARRRGENTYYVNLTEDSVRVSCDWEVTAPDRGHLESEVVDIELITPEGTTVDTASVLI